MEENATGYVMPLDSSVYKMVGRGLAKSFSVALRSATNGRFAALGKKMGLTVESAKRYDGESVYSIG